MQELKFHHIGVATKNIEREFATYEKLGYKRDGDVFCDEIQKIRGLFITAPGHPCLELLENVSDDGPLTTVLDKGIKYYHTAYQVENIDAALEWAVEDLNAIIICPITEATYFEKICFLMLRNRAIIEFVQLKK